MTDQLPSPAYAETLCTYRECINSTRLHNDEDDGRQSTATNETRDATIHRPDAPRNQNWSMILAMKLLHLRSTWEPRNATPTCCYNVGRSCDDVERRDPWGECGVEDGTLERGDMDEHIDATVTGSQESVPLINRLRLYYA